MNKFQKIILFLFSYVFSMKVTNIEPKTATIGERVEFTLTVEDYDSSQYYRLFLSNSRVDPEFWLDCPFSESSTTLKCTTYLSIYDKEDLNNLTKTLFLNFENTNLTVTIEKPKSLKLLFFFTKPYYSFGISSFYFEVNFNELYNSDFSIKFGDLSITNCSVSDSFSSINCYYEFPENYNGQTLNLNFGGENTEYSITINSPQEFSSINYLDTKIYYVNSSEQDFYFNVDSSYKINEHSFKLVPETSTNENITLSKCTNYSDGIYYAKCSGLLNKIDKYYIFVDNKNTSLKIFIYPVPTAITKVEYFKPRELLISSSTIFTIEVDYIVNLDKAVFTLVNEYDDTNKVYLTKCSKVENSVYYITCEGTIENAGKYYIYLNGIKQNDYLIALSSSLSKALEVEPKLIKFDQLNTELNTELYITIYFDSTEDFTSKKITLKGNENEANLTFNYVFSMYMEYKPTFPAVDTYYVYIDDVKQNVSILVTNEEFTSKVTAIYPTSVLTGKLIKFLLTVDTNLGIEQTHFAFKIKNDDSDKYYNNTLICEADSLEKTKAICRGFLQDEGEYYVRFRDGTEFKDVTVTAKTIPSLNSFYPISISPSSKEQTITLTFSENISNYVDKVKFIFGTETVETKCTADSNYVLYCSAVFNNEDDYFITIDGVYTVNSINVNEDDNINEEEEKNETKNSVKYLKISSLLLTLLLLF